MSHIASVLLRIIPKEMDVLRRRYSILNCIQLFQPIGRRSLSQRLNISEKLIRTDTEFLKSEGHIDVTAGGMEITESGNELLENLKEFIDHMAGLNTIQDRVKKILECSELIIVPGNVDEGEEAMKNIAKTTAKVLQEHLVPQSIVALTGGSTVYHVINSIKASNLVPTDITIVPARGSLGNKVDYQANTLVAILAEKLGCEYKLLNIPDNLSQKALESVRGEPDIQKTFDYILKANIILYGIGNVDEMAERRNLDEETRQYLSNNEAVAEALGYYFNKEGDIVYTSRSIGVTIDQMKELNYPIAVAGGAKKAEAILAVRKFIRGGCLIIDEGAAKEIIKVYENVQ